MAGNQNQAYRSVMKTLLVKQQTCGRSKHVRRDERFFSLAQTDKLYHELKWNMVIKRAHWGFYWPNTHASTLLCWSPDARHMLRFNNILNLKSPINVNKYRLRPTRAFCRMWPEFPLRPGWLPSLSPSSLWLGSSRAFCAFYEVVLLKYLCNAPSSFSDLAFFPYLFALCLLVFDSWYFSCYKKKYITKKKYRYIYIYKNWTKVFQG